MGNRGPRKGEGGRPKIEIDWTSFEAACKLMATKEEVLNLLSVNETTLDRHIKERYKLTFEGALKKFGSKTKISLRRLQLQLAKKNVAMAIWLGKQFLGQRERYDDDTDDGLTIIHVGSGK